MLTLNGLGWFSGCLLGLTGIALLALGREPAGAARTGGARSSSLMAVVLPVGYHVLSSNRRRILDLLA